MGRRQVAVAEAADAVPSYLRPPQSSEVVLGKEPVQLRGEATSKRSDGFHTMDLKLHASTFMVLNSFTAPEREGTLRSSTRFKSC